MRTVTLDVSKLGLVVGNVVTLKLIDSVGNDYVAPSGYTINEDITLTSDTLSVKLLENEKIQNISYYKLILPNKQEFNFQVPLSLENIPHDLMGLSSICCVDDVINKYTKELSNGFILKLEKYFTGENPHFSDGEQSIINLYEYYANEVIATSSTVDTMKMIDESLATIQGEI